MNLKLIQWNINGFLNNYTDLQGVGVFIKSNIPQKEIQINNNFQMIALEITLNIKFTIV